MPWLWQTAQHFDRLIEFLKPKRENITFHDIISLAEVAAQSLQGFFQAMDAKVYRELREIAGYIESMRTEIGALQVNDLKNTRIPSAGRGTGRHRQGDRNRHQHHHGPAPRR